MTPVVEGAFCAIHPGACRRRSDQLRSFSDIAASAVWAGITLAKGARFAKEDLNREVKNTLAAARRRSEESKECSRKIRQANLFFSAPRRRAAARVFRLHSLMLFVAVEFYEVGNSDTSTDTDVAPESG
jgi:hypothetical protein